MARYLTLLRFTEQGLRNVQKSRERAADFRGAVEAAGGSVDSQYWSLGECDGCVVFEVPREETAVALLLKLGQACNVRTQSMRLFDDQEFATIVGQM